MGVKDPKTDVDLFRRALLVSNHELERYVGRVGYVDFGDRGATPRTLKVRAEAVQRISRAAYLDSVGLTVSVLHDPLGLSLVGTEYAISQEEIQWEE